MSQNKVFDRYIKTEKGKAAVSKAVNKYVKTERGKAVTASSRAKNAVKVTFELRKSTDKDILAYFPDTSRPAFVRSSIRIAHAIQADLEAAAKFVAERVLNIDIPKIVLCDSMPIPTTRAWVNYVDGHATIYINVVSNGAPLDFCLFHEMRHIFQIKYFSTHDDKIAKTWRAEANALAPQEDTNRYNNQNIEIDANSFAIAMHLMTQKPDARRVDAFIEYLFYNQNETIRDKIFDNTMAFLGLED